MGPWSALSVCLSVLSVCNVCILWLNGWMDEDASWYGGRPRLSLTTVIVAKRLDVSGYHLVRR